MIRGAGGSAGRTSWSAKHELADYTSFYGFVLSFLDGINRSESPPGSPTLPSTNSSTLILGGYSYGSLIARSLPPLPMVIEIFTDPPSGSAQAEIMFRARDLSKDYLVAQQPAEQLGRNSLRGSAGLVVGGYESEATGKRMSIESSRKSLDMEGVRRSVERVIKRHSRRVSGKQESSISSTLTQPQTFTTIPKICYLLVSPLLAPITAILSLSSKLKLPASIANGKGHVSQDELLLHPSCCVFGSSDMFTSHKRLRKWSSRLQKESQARFSTYEIPSAGHFWQEDGAVSALSTVIEQWLGQI